MDLSSGIARQMEGPRQPQSQKKLENRSSVNQSIKSIHSIQRLDYLQDRDPHDTFQRKPHKPPVQIHVVSGMRVREPANRQVHTCGNFSMPVLDTAYYQWQEMCSNLL